MKLGFFSSLITDGNPTTGFEIANEAIVAGLQELGHEVSVIGLRLPRQGIPKLNDVEVLKTINLENSEAGKLTKLNWLARAILSRLPIAASKLKTVPNTQLEKAIQTQGTFDAHIINSYQMAAAFPQLTQQSYIYVAHNVEHRSAKENAVSANSIIEKYFYRRDEKLLKILERNLCDNADYVWALSDDDLLTHRVNDSKGGSLPLVVPLVPKPKNRVEKLWDVGLIGTWSWQPNLVGLNWFLKEIVPQIPKDYKIAIAGSTPTGLSSSHPNLKFLGRVENASQFLQSVRVIPLVSRGGTGVQLKTIEAFQAGYSCVATNSSVRGIDQLPSNCQKAEEPKAFASGLVTLVENSRQGKEKQRDGHAFYRKQKAAMLNELSHGLSKLA